MKTITMDGAMSREQAEANAKTKDQIDNAANRLNWSKKTKQVAAKLWDILIQGKDKKKNTRKDQGKTPW